ncbi:MAG TPA: hypothetical protein VKQ30_09810 [Ktedonobacterales bacterium]|nr:hypothetical protein [Ktedonobacterales bacterium]
MPKSMPQPDPEDAHTDLLATLAASRELGPEMDKALAESYMQKHTAAVTPAQAPLTQDVTEPRRFGSSDWATAVVLVAGIAAFTVAMVATGGHAIGFIWLFFVFGGWRWWGWGHRNAEYRGRRMEYRQAHREMRDDWRAMRRGYYRMSDPDRPSAPTLPEPVPSPVRAPSAPAQPPSAAPLPPVMPAPVAPPVQGGSGTQPPTNPAG